MLHGIIDALHQITWILREEGYDPVIVGTFALVLQGWLPESYIAETKDVDTYVSNPDILVDLIGATPRLVEKLEEAGFTVSVHEAGGIEVAAPGVNKPIEILYPVADIYIPQTLLRETVTVSGLKVLEAHAVVVAKAVGDEASLMRVADELKRRGIKISTSRLFVLAEGAAEELRSLGDYAAASKLLKRIKRFIGRLQAVGTDEFLGVMA